MCVKCPDINKHATRILKGCHASLCVALMSRRIKYTWKETRKSARADMVDWTCGGEDGGMKRKERLRGV